MSSGLEFWQTTLDHKEPNGSN